MKRRNVVAVVIALSVFLWARSRERGGDDSGTGEASRATEKYRPTVQEGLGASVAILLDTGSMADP
jgi:hypothetical protein